MRAMVLTQLGGPLELQELPVPLPGMDQVLLRVEACGVCRTDLHLIDGEVEIESLPRVLGHQIVGIVQETGKRVGVPWLGWTCGECEFCRSSRENLCRDTRFTGRDIDGGFAEYTVADKRYCFPIPASFSPAKAAPLLCAGLIGYRAFSMCGGARRIGIYGFGSAAHIIAQVARSKGRSVHAFTRAGDEAAQEFARALGAAWVGDSTELPPEPLDAAIIFAPVGELVPLALRAVKPGASVICAGIHMSDIPSFPYKDLWEERSVRSVANLTRADGALLDIAAEAGVETEVHEYPLERANDALRDLRTGAFTGSAVLNL